MRGGLGSAGSAPRRRHQASPSASISASSITAISGSAPAALDRAGALDILQQALERDPVGGLDLEGLGNLALADRDRTRGDEVEDLLPARQAVRAPRFGHGAEDGRGRGSGKVMADANNNPSCPGLSRVSTSGRRAEA
jgi:hypothetical protein